MLIASRGILIGLATAERIITYCPQCSTKVNHDTDRLLLFGEWTPFVYSQYQTRCREAEGWHILPHYFRKSGSDSRSRAISGVAIARSMLPATPARRLTSWALLSGSFL